MGKIIVLPETTQNPISLIGMRAGVCWGADITDAAKNYKRGLECIENNHGRTLEYVNVELVVRVERVHVMLYYHSCHNNFLLEIRVPFIGFIPVGTYGVLNVNKFRCSL